MDGVFYRSPGTGKSAVLPSFETERLLVRPRTMADFEACLAMDRDIEVTRYIPGPWQDPPRHEAFVRGRMQADYGPGLGYWTIVGRFEPGRFLGWILLIPTDGSGPEIEIGWRLIRAAWGKGYATEAAKPVMRHAFLSLGVERIIAEIAPGNAASIRVAEKLGLKAEGESGEPGARWRRYAVGRADAAGIVA